MRIQAYTRYSGALVITAATVRPDEAPSTHFVAATIQEDYAAQVRGFMEEHRHIPPTSNAYPTALRLTTYFPTNAGLPLYLLKQLMPAGAPRDIDEKWMLEITRLRYDFVIDLLPAAFAASPTNRSALERAIEYAVQQLFKINSVVPQVFVPGENTIRPVNQGDVQTTEVDILCELGPASVRTGVDIPDPASG